MYYVCIWQSNLRGCQYIDLYLVSCIFYHVWSRLHDPRRSEVIISVWIIVQGRLIKVWFEVSKLCSPTALRKEIQWKMASDVVFSARASVCACVCEWVRTHARTHTRTHSRTRVRMYVCAYVGETGYGCHTFYSRAY